MRFWIPAFAILALCLPAAQADAARSCSGFAVIKAFDPDASTIEVSWDKGNERKFFPKPEGTPRGPSKIPESCKRRITKNTTLPVMSTGGKLSITQVRTNLDGSMMNDADDEAWLGGKLKELVAGETQVVIVVRPGPGKDSEPKVMSIYLPITDEELAEIKRREDEAEDVD